MLSHQKLQTSCAFIGLTHVGKTTLIKTIVGESSPYPVKGTDKTEKYTLNYFATAPSESKSVLVELNLLDVAFGDLERAGSLKEYGVSMVVFVFDLSRPSSFTTLADKAEKWLKTMEVHPLQVCVIGLKSDKPLSPNEKPVSFLDMFHFGSKFPKNHEDYKASCMTDREWIQKEFKCHLMKSAFAAARRARDSNSTIDTNRVAIDQASFPIIPTTKKVFSYLPSFNKFVVLGLVARALFSVLTVMRKETLV